MAQDLLGTLSLMMELPAPSAAQTAIEKAKTADEEDFRYSQGTLYFAEIDTENYRKNL
ncbi:hypothetical protein [Lactimicrobium sp.]|jgi:hypothetical protein|uniref:hypothetical protein n=1 Tax=Lactimicrobium sp. TaxID=2563780 RepID=UPI002F36109A